MFDVPAPEPGHLTVAAAATRLSVTEGRILQLIWSGALPASRQPGRRTWLLPVDAVEARARMGASQGRSLTAANAWGLLCLADERPTPWLDARTRRRLSDLCEQRGLSALHARLIERGRPHSYRTHPATLKRMLIDRRLMPTGATGAIELRLGLVGGERFDAYVATDDLDQVVKSFRLRVGPDSNVSLRVVPDFGADWPLADVAPLPAIALDLLEDAEPRARQVGHDLLARFER